MAPVVHGLEQAWGDAIQFVYLDIDDPRTEPFRRQLGANPAGGGSGGLGGGSLLASAMEAG